MSRYAAWLESLEQFKKASADTTCKKDGIEVAPAEAKTEGIIVRKVGAVKQSISLTRQEAEFVALSIQGIYGAGEK